MGGNNFIKRGKVDPDPVFAEDFRAKASILLDIASTLPLHQENKEKMHRKIKAIQKKVRFTPWKGNRFILHP